MSKILEGPIWRVILISVALFLAWQIVTINMADHYVNKIVIEGDEAALDKALWWDAGHPRALTLKAARLLSQGDVETAEPMLQEAVRANPADARPLLLLANIQLERGNTDVSDQMADLANTFMPVNYQVQKGLAAYWEERGQYEKAIAHLATALEAKHQLRDELYPVFLRIAENPAARELMAPIAAEPPKWWDGFVWYAAKNAENLDTLRILAAMRKQAEDYPFTERERSSFIWRLRKEGLIAEAYMVWVNGLDKEQRGALGYVYNGNFERDLMNSGFGWHARPPKNSGIIINTAVTYGIEGKEALFMSFKGKRVRFSHLSQPLFLDTGVYRLTGKVRPDKLKARKGLKWYVWCTSGAKGKVGESEAFLGTGDWRQFEFDITVPPECRGQTLQLRSIGNRDVDHEIRGEIWFDDLHIQLLRDVVDIDDADEGAQGSEVEAKEASKDASSAGNGGKK